MAEDENTTGLFALDEEERTFGIRTHKFQRVERFDRWRSHVAEGPYGLTLRTCAAVVDDGEIVG